MARKTFCSNGPDFQKFPILVVASSFCLTGCHSATPCFEWRDGVMLPSRLRVMEVRNAGGVRAVGYLEGVVGKIAVADQAQTIGPDGGGGGPADIT